MSGILVNGTQYAGAGVSRVRTYPCAIARGSWFAFTGMHHNAKLRPRRFSRIS